MNIDGTKVIVNKSAEELYEFLTLLDNYEKLMPENIEKFEIDGNSFIFGLKGTPEIRLIIKEKTAFKNVTLGAASSKLPFTLASDINEISEKECEVQIKFQSNFNPMMAMMVKKPLTKFISTLTENIQKL